MKKSWRPWTVLAALVAIAAFIGADFALNVVRREGWQGLWTRKKDFVKTIEPKAGPALDEVEKSLDLGK